MASAKVHINLSEGLIEAEGDETFVRAVYDDFKERLKGASEGGERPDERRKGRDGSGAESPARTRRNSSRRPPGSKVKVNGDDTPGVTTHAPKRDTSLDLAKLKTFMAEYQPKNNPERYVLYLHFLKEELGKDPCTMDQVYSCFLHMKDKIPKAFGQNLVDTRGKYGYIDFTGPNDITLTTTGLNHFNHEMPKKKAEIG